jgi:putative ATP-dependent endonuclease of OLD family
MIIKSLEIRNFRSFDETSSPLKFSDGINIIVGENNVGKSNILKSLELLKGRELSPEDYYKGETDREIRITAVIELNEEEMKNFAGHFVERRRPKQVERVMAGLKKTFELEYSSKQAGGYIVRFNDFEVLGGDHLYLSPVMRGGNYITVEWDEVAKRFLDPDNKLPLVELMEGTLRGKREVIHFRFNISNLIRAMFNERIKNFVEIRQCPSGTNQNVLESYDGTLVADVLSNLKNGNRVQRDKWAQIKREFHDLFPSLELEVTKPAKEAPKIMIVKEAIKYEVPVSFVGAGIWEIVILLTHLFSFENMCFGIDMPELHFHHHTIRLLRNILRGKSDSNQFLIVTHSPMFIEPDRLENVLIVREREGKTVTKQLDQAPDSNESERLRRHLDEHAREFFFSRAVLIVEGPTEKGAIPVFSKLLEKDFDKYGISIVEAGSQFCGVFIRILKAFDFPYLVMHDYDALMDILQSIERDGRSVETSAVFINLKELLKLDDFEIIEKMGSRIQSVGARRRKKIYSDDCFNELQDVALRYDVYVLPTDFEGILKRDRYEKFLKEARKFSGRKKSKVICGRYVAEKIAENNLKVPKEFRDVIRRIVKKSSIL